MVVVEAAHHSDWRPDTAETCAESQTDVSCLTALAPATSPREAAPLEFRPMLAGDAVLLELQDSQRFELGLDHSQFTIVEGRDLAYSEGSIAWTAFRGTRIVAIAGLRQTHKGNAVAWAALSGAVGCDHLAITRKARQVIEDAVLHGSYHRIEAIMEADNERAITWAECVGLRFNTVLRKYGPEGVTHMLFERIAE